MLAICLSLGRPCGYKVMKTPKNRIALYLFLTGLSFVLIALGIIYFGLNGTVSPALAQLMLVALLGLYVGFGILIASYRLISRLN